jgi:hypothetical protein
MKIFNKNQFFELSKKSGFPFISIYTSNSRLAYHMAQCYNYSLWPIISLHIVLPPTGWLIRTT